MGKTTNLKWCRMFSINITLENSHFEAKICRFGSGSDDFPDFNLGDFQVNLPLIFRGGVHENPGQKWDNLI